MQWWACSSLMSPPLPEEAGCASRKADCSTVGLCCVTITWQQIFKVHFMLRQQAFCCMRLLGVRILAGNAARLGHADSGKPRTCILCEKKHEWFYSNASTSLKNPLLVRVWPIYLRVKLYLRRLLFMQYKFMWLVRKHLCRRVGIRLNR